MLCTLCCVRQITVNQSKVGLVLSDLAQRRSQIIDVSVHQNTSLVRAKAPLAELRSYATQLRTLTSGLASLSMQLAHYEQMSKENEQKTVRAMTGL